MNQIIISGKVVDFIDKQHNECETLIVKIKNIEIYGGIPKQTTIAVTTIGNLKTFVESEISIGDNVLVVGRYKNYTSPIGCGGVHYKSIIVATSITKEEFKQYE